jgi:hypothetical protein
MHDCIAGNRRSTKTQLQFCSLPKATVAPCLANCSDNVKKRKWGDPLRLDKKNFRGSVTCKQTKDLFLALTTIHILMPSACASVLWSIWTRGTNICAHMYLDEAPISSRYRHFLIALISQICICTGKWLEFDRWPYFASFSMKVESS